MCPIDSFFYRWVRGVAIFAKACFGHPSPSKQQKINATTYASGGSDSSSSPRSDPTRGRNIGSKWLDAVSECLFILSTPSLSLRLRQNNLPYGYRRLKIFTSLRLRFQDFQRKCWILFTTDLSLMQATILPFNPQNEFLSMKVVILLNCRSSFDCSGANWARRNHALA